MTKKKKRWLIAFGLVVALVAGIVVVLPWAFRQWQYMARKDWKEHALPGIVRLAEDKQWVSQEIALISKPQPADNRRIIAERWLSDNMILMRNGEWLVYRSHCGKEAPHNVRDIFIAKGSNGKWYYSTCHFCVGMIALMMIQEGPPFSLATFVRHYNLVEFDGKSDECLKETKVFPDPDYHEIVNINEAGDEFTVDLSGIAADDESALASLAQYPAMKKLAVKGKPVTRQGLLNIAALVGLIELDLAGSTVDDDGIKCLSPLKQLRTLRLGKTLITDSGASHLADFPALSNLSLADTAIGDTGLKSIVQLKELESLDLSRTSITDDGLKDIRSLAKLKGLVLDGTKINDAGLAHLAGLANLVCLSLNSTGVTDAGLDQIADLTEMRTIQLCNTKVGDLGLRSLAAMHKLEHLCIRSTAVTDKGMEEIGRHGTLRLLCVSNTQITDAGLKQVDNLHNLQWLDLTGTPTSEKARTQLQSERPKLQVVNK